MTRIRIWYVVGEFDSVDNTSKEVTFRVRTAAKSGKRMALRLVRESDQAKMLKLKNIRTVGIEQEHSGVISWNAPQKIKQRFYRLRTAENKQIRQEIATWLKKRSRKRKKEL